MKNLVKYSSMPILLVCMLALIGCTSTGGHEQYRGNENYPGQARERLYVDPNTMYSMSKSQFREYSKRMDWYNSHMDRNARNNANYARSEREWIRKDRSRGRGGIIDNVLSDGARTLENELSRAFRDGIRDAFR